MNHPQGENISSAWGKSDRDYPTLVNAFGQMNRDNIYLRIYCGGSGFKMEGHKNITIIHELVKFKDSIKIYNNAEFVVVPLINRDRTLGITSMYDAMAMSKALIISRNSGIDIDFEKEKMGLWVEPGDTRDLKEKMLFLLDNPDLCRQFGQNGKRYLDEKYNYQKFCEQLYTLAKTTHQEYLVKWEN